MPGGCGAWARSRRCQPRGKITPHRSLYLLIPLSIALVALIIGVLWCAVRAGQFDDLEGPAHAILLDDDSKPAPTDSTIIDPHQKAKKP